MNRYPDKLIVLDMDGCVTSIEDGTYFNPDPKMYHPSSRIVDMLRKFCLENDVKILISSNWRKFDEDGVWKNSYGEYKNPLPSFRNQISDIYFDTLPAVRHVNKSSTLAYWLDMNKDFNGKFAIFDDDLKEQFQNTVDYDINKKFIHINPQTGITTSDLESAKRIMNCE